jgi:uncharacterized protein (DUF58 family)
MFTSIKKLINTPLNLYKISRKRFYDGPDWIDLPNYMTKRKSGYKSPTLLLCAWSYAWYIRIFTVPGRMIISAVGIIVLYGTIISDGPLRILAFILLSLLFTDFIGGLLFFPKFKIQRKIPHRLRAGNMIKIHYTITNLRKLPAWNVHIDPIHQYNWMRLESDIASFDTIKSNETISITAFLQSEKRGEYILKPLFASTSFPFGIIKWTWRNKISQRILVYPKYEPLNSLQLPMNSRFQREGISMVSNVGESLEFHTCREFRTGDNPKHIHWPTTARKNKLIVREFQEEFLCRIGLIVDTFVPAPKSIFKIKTKKESPEFEAALSLTAALSHYLAHGDYIVDIFAAGKEVYHFTGGRSLAQLDQILDILACLEPNRYEPMTKLEPAVLEEMASIGSAMLLLLHWDSARKKFVDHLHQYGIALKIILISNQPAPELPDNALLLRPADIFAGNITTI